MTDALNRPFHVRALGSRRLSLKTIVQNASWVGFIQILDYLVPSLTLPIVTRAFGPAAVYGILAAFNAYAACCKKPTAADHCSIGHC
jgi:hypothetical protein